MDFIFNGQAEGDVASMLMKCNFETNALRPYIGDDGRTSYIDRVINGTTRAIKINTTATLRKDDWKILDAAVLKVARERLRAIMEIVGRGLVFNIPNGLGKTILETETMGDINDASVSMDGLRQNENDRPEFELSSLPLPITHKDFEFSARQIATSRNGGSPLDTTMVELSTRKVAESNEKMLLGRLSSYTYGGGTIYGLTNYPTRMTATLTAPTTSGWTGSTLVGELLGMRQQAQNAYHYGPFLLYCAPSWDRYLDADYGTNYPKTIRSRIGEIEGMSTPMTLDFLQNYDMILLQATSDVIRMVIGMSTNVVQWPTNGGLSLHFKVMNIIVPQLRADQNSRTGVVHGSTS